MTRDLAISLISYAIDSPLIWNRDITKLVNFGKPGYDDWYVIDPLSTIKSPSVWMNRDALMANCIGAPFTLQEYYHSFIEAMEEGVKELKGLKLPRQAFREYIHYPPNASDYLQIRDEIITLNNNSHLLQQSISNCTCTNRHFTSQQQKVCQEKVENKSINNMKCNIIIVYFRTVLVFEHRQHVLMCKLLS